MLKCMYLIKTEFALLRPNLYKKKANYVAKSLSFIYANSSWLQISKVWERTNARERRK